MNPISSVARKLKRVASFAKLHMLAQKHSSELKLIQDNLGRIRSNEIILFSVMKNETRRLPYFLDYYRSLGVGHFIFVDNNSDDDFNQLVAMHDDVTAYHTGASYKDSNFGVHWLNYLLTKHGTHHWCVTADPDEFFVYPRMDTRNLGELTAYLDANQVSSFYTLMIDMYGQGPLEDAVYEAGQNPLDVCPYFDESGYSKSDWGYWSATSAIGGVRRRVFFKTCPERSPALNKIPLVKWKRHFVYALSTHVARPNFLNDVCRPNRVTGALLHFKFISELQEKVEEEKIAKQHWDDSFEYRKYDEIIGSRTLLYNKDISSEYENWKTLVELGLINMGEW